MSIRFGICLFAHQIQELWSIPPDHQPHLKPSAEVAPEIYICSALDWSDKPPPPPIQRAFGAFEIRPGDCETCSHFHPAGEPYLSDLVRTSARRLRARRAAKRRRAAAK